MIKYFDNYIIVMLITISIATKDYGKTIYAYELSRVYFMIITVSAERLHPTIVFDMVVTSLVFTVQMSLILFRIITSSVIRIITSSVIMFAKRSEMIG